MPNLEDYEYGGDKMKKLTKFEKRLMRILAAALLILGIKIALFHLYTLILTGEPEVK